MPTGSVREFAAATDRNYRKVYRSIEKGKFDFPEAELIEENHVVYRVKWKAGKPKKVNSK